MTKNSLKFILWIGFILINLKSAHAYLDPGTGSMILQILIGGIATGSIIIKTKWSRIKEFLKRKNVKDTTKKNENGSC